MQTKKSLSLQIAGATALAMLFGTSAFAESRHHSGTSGSSGGHSNRSSGSRSSGSRSSGSRSSGSSVQSDRSASRSQSRSSDRGSWQGGQSQRNTTREFSQRDNSTQRSVARDTQRSTDWRGNNTSRYNSSQRSDSRYNNSNQRNGQRSVANDRFRSVAGWQPGGRAPYAAHERVSSFGRVDRFERWNGGYRVWLGGGLYPIFVPFERWRLFPLRIGLNIRFGGFWDPLGYWSVYDYSPYDGYYGGGYANVYGYNDGYNNGYNNDAYTSGEVRGTVESIDFRRGTMVINDDTSRQFVTITLPRDRRIDDIRAGDYVEFSGGWTRRGVFEASRLERFDEGRGDGYDRNDPRNDDRRY
jgi:hypothetical protein